MKINEKLGKKGKNLSTVSNEEFRDVMHSVGLRQEHERDDDDKS